MRAVLFYFAPASSTSSVAAIRDRHASGRHAPTPNARPYVAPKHYYAHILFFVASSQQPAATSQQRLPRSAPATPTAVTPQRPTVERQTTVVAALASALRLPFWSWFFHSESIFCSCRFILAHVSSTASVAAIRGRNVNGRHDRTPNDRTQDPRQLWFSVRIVLQFLFWRPLRQPHQLPRSAAATPTAVHAFCHVCRNGVGRPTLARAHWLSYQTAATATAVRLYLMNNSEA